MSLFEKEKFIPCFFGSQGPIKLNKIKHLNENKIPWNKVLRASCQKSFVGIGFMFGQKVESLRHRSKKHLTVERIPQISVPQNEVVCGQYYLLTLFSPSPQRFDWPSVTPGSLVPCSTEVVRWSSEAPAQGAQPEYICSTGEKRFHFDP